MAKTTTDRLVSVDILRAIAILIVVVFHCKNYIFGDFTLPYKDNWIDFSAAPSKLSLLFYPVQWGWAGVRLFFVLSGFSIHYSVLKSLDYNSPLAKNFLLPYAFRRFFRIYPPYFFVCLACVLSQPYFDTSDVITHLLLIHNFYEPYFFGINPSFWSIAVEVQFYLLYPLFLLSRNRFGIEMTIRFQLLLSVFSLITFFFLDPPPVHYSLWTSPPVSWVEWGVGALIAERYFKGKPMPPVRPIFLWLAACLFVFTQIYAPLNIFSAWAVSGLSALVLWNYLHKTYRSSIVLRFLVFLSVVSYSVYLFHQPLIPVFFDPIRKATSGNMLIQLLIGIPAFVFITTGLGWLFFQVIERPYMEYGKALLTKRV